MIQHPHQRPRLLNQLLLHIKSPILLYDHLLNMYGPKELFQFFFLELNYVKMIIIVVGGNVKKIYILLIGVFIALLIIFLFNAYDNQKETYMINLGEKSIDEIKEYSRDYGLNLEIVEEYSETVEKGKVISQNILEQQEINVGDTLIVHISLGKLDKDIYKEYDVNELGNVPIMMYHGIHNVAETNYVGGNVDKDGYQRTANAFRNDLEFYYNSGYRMISLSDYVEGKIDVELGKSPVILTFDDGLANNILVTGLDQDGEIIIDPNSAVGILEDFKNNYPDFNVTATFFINGGLFGQPEYNEKIIKWLIDNGYSIGNHSYNHVDLSNTSKDKTMMEIGSIYNVLESIIPGEYDKIVALPFGSPYVESADSFSYILSGNYQGINYETVSTLRVGWESELSPFNKYFNKSFLKRIRAYDNNGTEFDIEMNFKILETTRYISDGNVDTIVVPEIKKENISNKNDYKIITY